MPSPVVERFSRTPSAKADLWSASRSASRGLRATTSSAPRAGVRTSPRAIFPRRVFTALHGSRFCFLPQPICRVAERTPRGSANVHLMSVQIGPLLNLSKTCSASSEDASRGINSNQGRLKVNMKSSTSGHIGF